MTTVLPKVAPLLAKPRAAAFDHPGWLFELKNDGFRALLQVDAGDGHLISCNANRFAHLDALASAITRRLKSRRAILDGEVICADETGRPIFLELLRRCGQPCYIAFDLLWLDGEDLRRLPLLERKRRLKRLLPRRSGFVIAPLAVDGSGRRLMASVVAYDLEKRKVDPYRPGVRWWKIKNPTYS